MEKGLFLLTKKTAVCLCTPYGEMEILQIHPADMADFISKIQHPNGLVLSHAYTDTERSFSVYAVESWEGVQIEPPVLRKEEAYLAASKVEEVWNEFAHTEVVNNMVWGPFS